MSEPRDTMPAALCSAGAPLPYDPAHVRDGVECAGPTCRQCARNRLQEDIGRAAAGDVVELKPLELEPRPLVSAPSAPVCARRRAQRKAKRQAQRAARRRNR